MAAGAVHVRASRTAFSHICGLVSRGEVGDVVLVPVRVCVATLMGVVVPVAVTGVRQLAVRVQQPGQGVEGVAHVALVLQHHVRRLGERRGAELGDAEHTQRPRPVDGFGDARALTEL